MPEAIRTDTGEFIGGKCECGAVYACDPTGHNVGEAYLDALIYASGGDWNKVQSGDAESYQETVRNYDMGAHRTWEIRDIRRDYTCKIVFIKVGPKQNDK
jgi:hypothetical protein